MNLKNKKAVLQSETLKILFIVFVLGFVLIPLASKTYAIFISDSEKEKAKSSLDEIFNTINYMKENNIKENSVLILNPDKWYLLKNSDNEICICEEINLDLDNKLVCQKREVCEKINFNFEIVSFEEFGKIDSEEKTNSIKISKSEINILQKSDIYYLSSDSSSTRIKDILDKFLDKEISEKDKNELKSNYGDNNLKIYNIKDLLRLYCISSNVGFNQILNEKINNYLSEFFNKYEFKENDFIFIKLRLQKNKIPNWNFPSYSDSILNLNYPKDNFGAISKYYVFDSIKIEEDKYCGIYVSSNKNNL